MVNSVIQPLDIGEHTVSVDLSNPFYSHHGPLYFNIKESL